MDIVVIGSLNMDLVVRAPRLPASGETLLGETFQTVAGGKGANQAVAAARLGARVAMVGRVGSDAFGARLLAGLTEYGVDAAHVRMDAESPTGTATIIVDDAGENSIIVVPGANGRVTTADVDASDSLLMGARMVILQFEIPLPVVEYALDQAARHRIPVILNAAPARRVARALLNKADILVVNEVEAQVIAGVAVADVKSAAAARQALGQATDRSTIITVGAAGAFLATAEGAVHFPAPEVDVVDTTAAGDAFVGGLAVALLGGAPLAEAVRSAICAGSLAVTRFGAQTSLPTAQQLREFSASRRCME